MTPTRGRISRRLLLTGGAAFVGSAGAAYHVRRVRWPSTDDVAALIERRVGHLPLAGDAIDLFASEYNRRFGVLSMSRHHRDTVAGLLSVEVFRRMAPAAKQQALLDFERRMVSYFLRSTDYFRTPPGTVVRYVAFPDPYELPCSNPLAVLTI
jgi:hypothetical protein